MTVGEFREAVRRNLSGQDLDLRVQPDRFGTFRVAAVSSRFQDLGLNERRAIALSGVDDSDVAWVQLLTPAEKEWVGPLPIDSDLPMLPFWPEAMERPSDPKPAFPTELDSDLPTPITVTFYSVRGGVGRSTALAYSARILASRGFKVLAVDMDLEAPGLAALFGLEQQIEPGCGVVPMLAALDRGDAVDFRRHLVRVGNEDGLFCVPAGRPGPDYARLLRLMDPEAWYTEERNPLQQMVDGLKRKLPFAPDVLLLDSRTGISDISAPLLFDLADLVVVAFFPHPQARTATGEVVKAIVSSRTTRGLTPEPRFLVSPVPNSRAPEVRQRYKDRSTDWVQEWMKGTGSDDPAAFDGSIHWIPYQEAIATSDTVNGTSESWRDFEPVADWIQQLLPSKPVPATVSDAKLRILGELRFAGGTAEDQADFIETFVQTDIVNRALDPAIPLVRGRKGVGKTAIFRYLLEKASAVPVTAPAQFRAVRPWILTPDGFLEARKILERSGSDWRVFWQVAVALACHYGRPGSTVPEEIPPEILPPALDDVSRLIVVLERLFGREGIGREGIGMISGRWLDRLDRAQGDKPLLLLFDALDTGFGFTPEARRLRTSAIEGLCALLIDRQWIGLRPKILLRDDIWRSLRFENKSHLFGKEVTLSWRDQAHYLKVALKQAVGSSKAFADVLRQERRLDTDGIDYWSEADVFQCWQLLVGERMKGGKTAFTRNWIWNRLADGSRDHSPRYLLQLLAKAVEWERSEYAKSPVATILRPRALTETLPIVSEQAVDAIGEEFPELENLLATFKRIGRTPFRAVDLKDLEEEIALALEIGLIEDYEESDKDPKRYKVPDIYRYALEMTRHGQA